MKTTGAFVKNKIDDSNYLRVSMMGKLQKIAFSR